ncbi:MAG: 4-(cytidine 5'-diphospho)-2-C-methyl-D-erythritol kinase [Bacteroidetes bacterium 41-46]|nr:MAG: 4-(cytidine 5'-diphospho)-2-C-methyl-D-erythritol kinase [Bacteroidetes bacterium 41-46]
MIVYPKAKVNIGLRIIGKRNDGFHDLETFFISAGKSDVLEVTESSELIMNQYGLALDSEPMKNLCVKAYEAMRSEFAIPPVEINLFKRIPFGAGLGGGSADAAGTIIAINKLYKMELPLERLAKIASKVGSDCPFFVYADSLDSESGEGMVGRGRGDILNKYTVHQLSDYEIRVITPDIFISTAEAYSGVEPSGEGEPIENLLKHPVEEWKGVLFNDFERHIFKLHPQIRDIKERMYSEGALYASMSGSGSAVYGIFRR